MNLSASFNSRLRKLATAGMGASPSQFSFAPPQPGSAAATEQHTAAPVQSTSEGFQPVPEQPEKPIITKGMLVPASIAALTAVKTATFNVKPHHQPARLPR